MTLPRRASVHGLALALTVAVAGPAVAQDGGWTALVIGNPSRSAPQAFADSFNVSEALRAAGIGEVRLERELGADAMAAALDGLAGTPRVLLYFAGPIAAQDQGTVLMGAGGGDARAALGGWLGRLSAAGTTEAAVLIEDCALPAGQGDGMAGKLVLPDVPPGLTLFLAATAGPEGTCATAPARLTDRLAAPTGGASLTERLAGLWIGMDPGPGFGPAFAGAPAAAPAAAPAEPARSETLAAAPADPAAPDSGGTTVTALTGTATSDTFLIDTGADVITPVTDELVVLSVAEPVQPAAQTVSATTAAADLSVIDDQTVVFIAPAASQIAALPLAQGLPEPSIIVGLLSQPEAAFDTVPETQGEVTQNEISYENLEARLALKESDPDLYKSLVEAGAFDPPDVDLAIALQTELARMKCYTSGIDGDWGNGSRASVDRYFAELDGQTPVSRDPTIELFRQIILEKDVTCPAPVVVQQSATRSNGSSGTRTQQAAPRAAATQTPAPTPKPSGGLNSGTALGGVYR